MSKSDFVTSLTKGDLARILDDIPQNVRLDILQLGLDLLGLVTVDLCLAAHFAY